MSPDDPSRQASLAEVATLLGLPDSSALHTLDIESLRKRTHRQLLEGARRLGLSGVSKLTKDALADRLSAALRVADIEDAGHAVLTHKFEVGAQAGAKAEEPRTIPWGYGQDRITAMPVDPDKLYCYWEVTDEATERARGALGPGGAGAWLNLRVYDTTGRIFDGTNAHGYFDHKVERHERQWFFVVGKPASEAVVEIGLRSHEGYFVKIVRSSRVEFPRREPVAWSDPEWMTVRVTGETEHAGFGAPAQPSGGGDGAPGGENPRFEPVPLWQMRADWEQMLKLGDGTGDHRIEWDESWQDGFVEGHRTVNWASPTMVSSWESGPFNYPVEVPAASQESFEGPLQVFRYQGRTQVVYGPWQVVIRGLGAHYRRQVMSRWEVYRTWIAEEGHEIRGLRTMASGTPGGSSEHMTMGASERSWRGHSELRMLGGSEMFYLGASDKRMLGASELRFAGASEKRLAGSSERLGASETRLGGASEERVSSEYPSTRKND